MKLLTKLTLSAAAIAAAVAVANVEYNNPQGQTAAAMWGHEKNESAQTVASSYILQGQDTSKLAQIVSVAGGEIAREFPIINAVSALLTEAQADEIKLIAGVSVQDDRTVMTMSNSNAFAIDNNIADIVNADDVHSRLGNKGQGVTVAFVDSGANMGGLEGNYTFRDSQGRQKVAVKYDATKGRETYLFNDDKNGHGTHIANIIGSSLQAPDGDYNGIAPDAYLLSVKAFDHNGKSSYTNVLDALNWIYDNRHKYKIRVVNMSLGTDVQSRYWNDPINQAVSKLWQAGVVIVASAGNNGESTGITVPGNNPYVITAGAMNYNNSWDNFDDDRIASFSSKGPTLDGFVKPDILAPGTDIAVKMDVRHFNIKPKKHFSGYNYYRASGTSQSAAVISGVAALIIASDPTISPDDVKCRILSAGRPSLANGGYNYTPFEQGAGLVEAYRAVTSTANGCANVGLDINADLAGSQRFLGPVMQSANGEYYITGKDGKQLKKGSYWADSGSVQDAKWGEGEFDIQGAHWGFNKLDLLGAHWGSRLDFALQGAHWGTRSLSLQSDLEAVAPVEYEHDMPIDSTQWK